MSEQTLATIEVNQLLTLFFTLL